MDQSWKMHYKYFGELNIVYTLNTFLNASVLDPRDLQGSAVLTKMKSVETTLTWSVADSAERWEFSRHDRFFHKRLSEDLSLFQKAWILLSVWYAPLHR